MPEISITPHCQLKRASCGTCGYGRQVSKVWSVFSNSRPRRDAWLRRQRRPAAARAPHRSGHSAAAQLPPWPPGPPLYALAAALAGSLAGLPAPEIRASICHTERALLSIRGGQKILTNLVWCTYMMIIRMHDLNARKAAKQAAQF